MYAFMNGCMDVMLLPGKMRSRDFSLPSARPLGTSVLDTVVSSFQDNDGDDNDRDG